MHDDATMTDGHKANFDTIYDQPDPRDYFTTLGPLDYQIPQSAKPVIDRVHAAASTDRTLLDVCCSYGINGALLRYDLDIAELTTHYQGLADASDEDFATADREFFATRPRAAQPAVLGLDAAKNAIDYARRTGLIVDGWAENLEDDDPTQDLQTGLRDVGMVVCTGGVGYVGAPTFERVVAATARPDDLWLAVWVLREFAYDEIAHTLDGFGLVTEQVPDRTFVQRRFASDDEQEAALHDVVARGLDPTGKESGGWFHADCYITRPAHAAAETPLADLLA